VLGPVEGSDEDRRQVSFTSPFPIQPRCDAGVEPDPEVLRVDPEGAEAIREVRERSQDQIELPEPLGAGRFRCNLADDEPDELAQLPKCAVRRIVQILDVDDVWLEDANLREQHGIPVARDAVFSGPGPLKRGAVHHNFVSWVAQGREVM
jgi:hypothetical protein